MYTCQTKDNIKELSTFFNIVNRKICYNGHVQVLSLNYENYALVYIKQNLKIMKTLKLFIFGS